jgi:hypothetical protein
MQHCGSRSKRIINVQNGKKNARLAGTNSKVAWKVVCKCGLGNKINHKNTKTMALRLPNGQKAKTDKKNMSVFHPPPFDSPQYEMRTYTHP